MWSPRMEGSKGGREEGREEGKRKKRETFKEETVKEWEEIRVSWLLNIASNLGNANENTDKTPFHNQICQELEIRHCLVFSLGAEKTCITLLRQEEIATRTRGAAQSDHNAQTSRSCHFIPRSTHWGNFLSCTKMWIHMCVCVTLNGNTVTPKN